MASALDPADFGPIHEDFRCQLRIAGIEDAALRVASYSGSETLSSLFIFEVVVATTPDTVTDLEAALGASASISIDRAGDTERVAHGIITAVSPDGAYVANNQARTVLTVEPRLANLCHSGGYRIFQDKTIKDIIAELVAPERIEVVWRVRPEPPKRDYRTQLDESDFNFVARLAADEGCHFFFEHDDEKTTLVFTNDPRGFQDVKGGSKTLSYRDTEGSVTGEHVRSLRRARAVRTGSVEHRDYDFKSPRTALVGRAETEGKQSEANTKRRERRFYPGGFLDPDAEGTPRARMRMQELRSDAFTFAGTASTLRLHPGATFTVSDHRDPDFNKRLVVTSVMLQGETPSGLIGGAATGPRPARSESDLCSFTAAVADTPLRPAQLPKPPSRLQVARVVGPAEGDPHVDSFGRVKVQFPWDRDGKHDEHSSCWMRMMTPMAHGDEGFYTAHKVGSEVLVDFIDGDIDRPVVLGAVYNGKETQVYKLPGKVTRSVWKVRGIPGGTGYNEITFENQSGAEQIIMHAQKDHNETILHDHNETIGNNQTSNVGVNQSITVGTDRTLSVGNNESISIGTNQTLTIGSNQTDTIGSNRTTTVGADESLTVMGQATKMVAMTDTVLVGAARSLTAASEAVTVGSRVKTVATSETTTVGGSRSENVGGSESVSIGGARTVAIGDADSLAIEKTLTTTVKEAFQLQVGDDAMIAMNKDGEILLKAGDSSLLLKKSGDIELKGKNLVIEADSKIGVKGDDVVIKGSKVAVN